MAGIASTPAAAPRSGDVLVDTGVLVALFNRDDAQHVAVTAWLARCTAALHTVEAVLTETSFFLPARLRPEIGRAHV